MKPVESREGDAGEVSDEDESADAKEGEDKPSKKSKLTLSPALSDCVTMKSVHFNSSDDIPTGKCCRLIFHVV